MKINHRIIFSGDEALEETLSRLGVKFKKLVSPDGQFFVILVKISDTDRQWQAVKHLIEIYSGTSIAAIEFTKGEVRLAEYARLMASSSIGYPLPEDTWPTERPTYDTWCRSCGTFKSQKEPFWIRSEPKLGKRSFATISGTDALLVRVDILKAMEEEGITGYELADVHIGKKRLISQVVKQLKPLNMNAKHVVEPHLSKLCSRCGISKHLPVVAAMLKIQADSVVANVDIQLTDTWFGDGALAFREFIVSQKLATFLLDRDVSGVVMQPIKLM